MVIFDWIRLTSFVTVKGGYGLIYEILVALVPEPRLAKVIGFLIPFHSHVLAIAAVFLYLGRWFRR